MANAAADLWEMIQDVPASTLLGMLNREVAMRSFSEFCKQAWSIVEPSRPLVWGWHLEAKCNHLQAVYNFTVPPEIDSEAKELVGIQSLIINEPPRCSKSLFSSVLFPAWVWVKWPGARFLNITYADDLAERDALKCRNLVQSSWYRENWPGREIREVDEYTGRKLKTATKRYDIGSQGGYRVSTTILGMATGEGGDFRIIDDPHNVKKSLSDVERNQANRFFDLTLPTRVVDPIRSSTIVCMQRLHEDDATGHVLEAETSDWDLLCLPMEYELKEGNRCKTRLGFVDPRSKEGELLHPERWSRTAVEKAKGELRMTLGEFGVNSQFQQRPTPLGGGMFKPENIILLPGWPPLSDMDRFVRYWDKAGTEGGGAFSCGILMARHKSTQRTVILDVVRGQWNTDQREMMIQQTAHQDLAKLNRNLSLLKILCEQEPGSGGKDSALWTTTKTLVGFNAGYIRKTESKAVDHAPFATQVNLGGVEMVVAPWNQALKKEMESAPFGKFKDQLDAGSGGFKYIWLGPQAGVIC